MAFRRSSVGPTTRRPVGVRTPPLRPRLVAPKVAHLMGLGDYCTVSPSGARVCYTGNDPNAPGGGATSPPVAGSLYEGMFVQDISGPPAPIYYVQGGQKHWVPDQTTLRAMGGSPGLQTRLPSAVLAAIPPGAPLPSIQIQTSTAAQPAPSAAAAATAPATDATAAAATVAASTTGNYVSTVPSYSSVLEPGATYDASTGYYTNPDGTIYAPAVSTSTFDISSPSTWPTWVWLALAAGGTWLLFFKRGR